MPGLTNDVRQAIALVSARARRANEQVTTVGIATDNSPKAGEDWLARYAAFDVIQSGAGWLNPGAVEYIWRDTPGDAALPQLLVVRRAVEIGDRSIVIGKDSVVLRLVGAQQIKEWVRAQSRADASSI